MRIRYVTPGSQPSTCGRLRGFTLLELSIVLLVISLIAGGLLVALTQNVRIRKQEELQAKMAAIEAGLLKFRRLQNRLPCPADGTLPITDPNFGVEAANPGTCSDGNPAANFSDENQNVGGVIPVRTLGIRDEFMFDPWGGRFTYAVDKRITRISAFKTYPATDTGIGSITIKDGNGNEMVNNAVAVLLSHGNNGHGAFQISGTRKSARSTNANEQINCHCNVDATPTNFDGTFVIQPHTASSANTANGYDDIVRYWLRSHLYSASDLGMR